MKAFKIPTPAADELDEQFSAKASLAGCGGNCGGPACGCQCGTPPPPSNGSGYPVPMMLDKEAIHEALQVVALGDAKPGTMPAGYVPYVDPRADEACMGAAVGTATIAAGATATVNIEPTQGCFDGYYIQIIAVDNAAPNTRGRVEVARFFIGDCPRECRNANVFSDVYEGLTNGCCQGVPFKASFGKTAMGEQLNVVITNPTGGFANARVQVIAKGFCKKSPASCAT